jgi:hypothetical protein
MSDLINRIPVVDPIRIPVESPNEQQKASDDGPPLTAEKWQVALSEWIAALGTPQNPPFSPGATFPDSEWGRVVRVFTVSTALAGVITIAGNAVPNLVASVIPDHKVLSALTLFACFGAVYSVYSWMFGVHINTRQVFFCFSLVITPWFPVYALIKATGGNLGVVWFVLLWGLSLHIFFLIARAISIVAKAGMFRVFLSLLAGALLAVAAVFTHMRGT